MKKRITLLLALICFLSVSCVKDYFGHGPDKIVLTEENNIYEGDLYNTFLMFEINRVEEQMNSLEKGQGNSNVTLKELEEKKATLEKELDANLVPDFLFRRIPRPKPPCPSPKNCDFLGSDFITSLSNSKVLSIKVLDANGETIGGTTGNQNTLSGTKEIIVVDDFQISDYSGAATILVVTEGENRLAGSYSFDTFIN